MNQDKEAGMIVLATVSQHANNLRGRIPAPIVRMLKARAGDVLAFERKSGGSILLRKSTTAERRSVSSTSPQPMSKTIQSRDMTALATVVLEDGIVRGRMPTPVIKMLKVKSGEMLAFERRADASEVVRKSTGAERKSLTLSRYRKASK
ncbi:MAG: hypothetical protein H0V88_02605 [Pyrinomonadaceae bacterium]|nr:hypothetical protein [Pyrinomonadaceae bacterium]